MELKYLTIGIEGPNAEEVADGLKQSESFRNIKRAKELLNMDISIKDLREEFYTMKKFLEENNLKDENPFFNEFEIEPFGVMIDFNVTQDLTYLDIIEPIVFVLGQQISSLFKTRTIVMFNNMRIPVGLFDNGILINIFERFNEEYFEHKVWNPRVCS